MLFFLEYIDDEADKEKILLLYHSYHQQLYYLAYSRIKDSAAAEDLVHETYITVIKHLEIIEEEVYDQLKLYLKKREKNANLQIADFSLENKSTVKNVMIAIGSKLGTASAIWDALTISEKSSDTVYLGTDKYQKNVYDGLVRAIANQAGSSAYLWGVKTSLGISGKYRTAKTYSSYRIAYSFTGYSLL